MSRFAVPQPSPVDLAGSSPRIATVLDPRQVEAFVRWSAYTVVLVPAISVGVGLGISRGIASDYPVPVWTATILSLLLVAGNMWVSRWSVRRVVGYRTPLSISLVVLWLAVMVTLVAVLLMIPDPVVGFPIVAVIASVPTSFIPLLTTRRTVWLNVLYVVLALMLLPFTDSALLAICTLLAASVSLWACWSTVWMLRVLMELQSAHEDRAALALADERLRISRDLHDVFGRTLAAIAVKSELAFELVRRGKDERAADELIEIRGLARDAGTEVRQVVRGELQPTWAAELAGAKSLLAAAGISCTIEGPAMPPAVADTFAWVIREGVTNVLRHSRARRVIITTTVATDHVRVLITNDGARTLRPSVADPHTGSGLLAMSERIRARGGRVSTDHGGDRFRLDATLPLLPAETGDSE